MLDREEVLRKIKAMEALVADPNGNPHEQENAMRIMQKLRTEYDVQLFELKVKDEIIEEDLLHSKRKSGWMKKLASILAKSFDCKSLIDAHSLSIMGAPHDIEVVKYMYESLSRTLQNGAKKAHKEYMENNDYFVPRRPATLMAFKNTYIIEASIIIGKRIEDARKKAVDDSGCTALVVTKEKAVEDAMREKYPFAKPQKAKYRGCNQAVHAGREHGRSVALSQGITQQSTGGQING